MSDIYLEDSLHPIIDRRTMMLDDTRFIVLSKMIKSFYDREGFTTEFCNSNGLLLEKAKSSEDGFKCVFMDFPVDNIFVKDLYLTYLKEIIEFDLDIILIPIPCVEYYATLSLSEKNNDNIEVMKDLGLYKSTEIYSSNMSKRKVSFERFCKAVFSVSVDQKYRGDCLVNHYNVSKADEERFVKSFPLYLQRNSGGTVTLLLQIVSNQHSMFINQINLYNVNGYIEYTSDDLKEQSDIYIQYLSKRLSSK